MKYLKKMVRNTSERKTSKYLILDSAHLIQEFKRFGHEVLETITDKPEESAWQVSSHDLQALRDVKNGNGPVVIGKKPVFKPLNPEKNTLVLDNVQDPGNVGTLIRTALGFRFNNIVLGTGCADIWNPKTLRSTQGSIFSENISLQQDIDLTAYNFNENAYGLMLNPEAMPLEALKANQPITMVIGSEGGGICEAIWSKLKAVYIPITSDIESLNAAVAGSIAMYHVFHARVQ